MGQSSSTQRDHHRISLPAHFALFRTERGRGNRDEEMNHRQHSERAGETSTPLGTELPNDNLQTLPSGRLGDVTEASEHPTFLSDDGSRIARNSRSIQEEDGPEFGISQQEYRSATFARMAARRQSTMSRLGSRFLPNSVIRGLLSSEEETPAEGHAHRHGVSRTIPRTDAVHNSSRFSAFSSLGSRGINRRRSLRGPYFIPRNDSALAADTSASPANLQSDPDRAADTGRSTWRRNARLHRVRRSLSNPISQIFGQQTSSLPSASAEHAPRPPSQSDFGDQFLPPPGTFDSQMDFDEPHELDSVEPAVRNTRPESPASNYSAQGAAGTRQLPGFVRARPSRVLRREEQTPLTRVLQLAAAAIAAQLSGTTGPVLPNIQALDNDGVDGSLENFIQSLQHATSAQTNPSTSNDTQNTNGDNGSPAPVNFLRVFRFAGNTNRSATESGNTGQADGMDVDNPMENPGPEGRIVTLVAVGVRSVPSGNGPGTDQPIRGHGLDALLRLPYLSPGMRSSHGGPSLPSRPDGPSRLFPSRHSLGGSSGLSANNEHSHQSGSSSTSRRFSDTGAGSPFSSLPSSLPGSPPSPHPPPSTPADPGLSTAPSGASTPSRRPSSASAMPPNTLPHVHEDQSTQPTVEPVEDRVPPNTARQRRRSDSEYARHRDLGSGRRNGIVEPDNATPPVGRSWLIYVVGTNVSENHPAIATPSLFTDVRIFPMVTVPIWIQLTKLEPDLRGYDLTFLAIGTSQATGCYSGGCELLWRVIPCL